MEAIRVLLIEDDEDDYFITKDLLSDVRGQRYQLDWVDNAILAKEKFSENAHDVCLLDQELGAEDGVSLLKDAPALGFFGPIIMLTGHNDSHLDEKALKAGAVDYLVKAQLNALLLARAIRYAVSRQEMEVERTDRIKAEAENRSKSEFLAHLSHELRTPMTAILGYTDLIASKIKDQALLHDLQIVKRNGNHLLSLLNDVLDLSKIEVGKLEIEQHVLELRSFVADIYELMKVHALNKGVDIFLVVDDAVPIYIVTDATRLRQVLLNLISNAIKFTADGNVTIKVQYQSINNSLSFEVQDTGTGISAGDIESLFIPFSQLKTSVSSTEHGTGLGLSISKQLVALLHGTISVNSELGVGSIFTVSIDAEIPSERLAQESAPDPGYYDQMTPSQTLSGHVLVVDDVPDIRFLIGQIIKSNGCSVSYAENGQEAVTAFKAQPEMGAFDLIVMDLQMPKLDGSMATQEIRKFDGEIPIIALTAATVKGERERCLAAGFSDYLSKPIDPARLVSMVSSHMRTGDRAPLNMDQVSVKTSRSILLVEDCPDVLMVTASLLEHLGYRTYTAENGEVALKLFSQVKPSLVLIDINLPDIDGFELSTRLRKVRQSGCILIALSGQSLTANEIENSCFDDHRLKPISLETLKSITQKYLPLACA